MDQITGSSNTKLEGIKAVPVTDSQAYFGAAQGLMHGARVLASAGPNSAMALTLITGHIVECLLKSYLSHFGKTEQELRQHGVRHNLVSLWTQTISVGLALNQIPPLWLSEIDNLHDSPFILRYPMHLNGLVLPATEPMMTDLDTLLDAVRLGIRT